MNKINLTSCGQLYFNGRTVRHTPLQFLGFQVEPERGFSLRSFFQMLEKYPDFQILNPFVPDCLAQYRRCPAAGCVEAGMDHLEFARTVEMIGGPEGSRVEIYCGLKGIYRTAGEAAPKPIRFLPLTSLLDSPLLLGKLKHIVFGDTMEILEFETAYNLFDFIEGILWELSFQGFPRECEIRR